MVAVTGRESRSENDQSVRHPQTAATEATGGRVNATSVRLRSQNDGVEGAIMRVPKSDEAGTVSPKDAQITSEQCER